MVVPILKTVGMSQGMLIWGIVNMLTGWAVVRSVCVYVCLLICMMETLSIHYCQLTWMTVCACTWCTEKIEFCHVIIDPLVLGLQCLSVCACRFGWLGLNQYVPPHVALNYTGVVLCLIRYSSISVTLSNNSYILCMIGDCGIGQNWGRFSSKKCRVLCIFIANNCLWPETGTIITFVVRLRET